MVYSKFKSLSLGLCTLTLFACGKAPEIDNQPLMREVQDPLVTESVETDMKDVTAKYKADLQGTLRSKSGTLQFHDENKMTIESIIPVRNASNYYLEDHYLDCKFKRTGTYRIIQSEMGLRLVFEPTLIHTMSAQFQKRGTTFDLDQSGKARIKTLCEDYAQVELSSPISGKLLSLSSEHLHFHHTPFAGEYDYEKKNWSYAVSKIGDDFTDFYIRGTELNISELFGKYYQGKYESSNTNGSRELSIISEDGSLRYEITSEDCIDHSEFEVYYNLTLGPYLKVTPQDNCSLLGSTSVITVNNFEFDKNNSFINLVLPFGIYSKILTLPNAMRD